LSVWSVANSLLTESSDAVQLDVTPAAYISSLKNSLDNQPDLHRRY